MIILGAGLAGLSLALGLSKLLKELKLDWEVHIVEKQADFSRTGATFGLRPNGQKALEELSPGIIDELKQVGILTEKQVSFVESGVIMLGWWNCRDALLARVASTGSITLHTGWMLQEIVEHDDSVQATFQKINAETTDDTLSLKGAILIGADGVNSVVRKHLNLPPAKKTNIMMWRTCLHINPQDSSPAAQLLRHYLDIPIVSFGRLRGSLLYFAFNFHEKLPGTMALAINYHGDDVDDIAPGTSPQKLMEENANDDVEVKEVQAILELCDKNGLHHPIRQKVVEVPPEDGHGWGGKGRITLIGDAAHGTYIVALAKDMTSRPDYTILSPWQPFDPLMDKEGPWHLKMLLYSVDASPICFNRVLGTFHQPSNKLKKCLKCMRIQGFQE